MTTMQAFTSEWHLNITALVISILLLIFHFVTNRGRFTRRTPAFLFGIFLLILVTFSPLEFFGQNYLFSAHMIAHIILLLIIPPFFLIGTDAEFLEKLFSRPGWREIGNFLFYPVVTWIFGIGSMWFWHAPPIFLATKEYMSLQVIQMISLLAFGTIFIWPVFSPIKFRRLQPLQSSLYLFLSCVGCTILGILITFAPGGLFTSYTTGRNPAILNLIQNQWGLTPDIDQEMGGLIMWVPACIIYVTYIMITLGKWYLTPETDGTAVNSGANKKT
jgi:cytochrome c oxidase assembly factor CtaG